MAIQSLTREQILRLLRAAKAKRLRDYLMFWVAFRFGLRATEVIHLTPDNFSATHITVQRLKGSLKTTQDLGASDEPLLDAKNLLFDYMRGMARNQRLFSITRQRFWQLFQEYGASINLPEHKRHPHVLKHSIATQTIERAGIENVRQHLGHKSIASTGEYLKVTDEDASAAIRKALSV